MNVIDYGASFIHGSVPENRIRFWVESRTRIIEEGRELCEVYHYSEVKSFPAKNTLFCVGKLDNL